LNITRARLEVPSGVEGSGSRYSIVNDNSDPNVINQAGFNWSTFDYEIDRLIGPWRKKVAAAGLQPYVVLTYVDFGASTFEHYNNPQEYGEFMLAVFQHMQSKYGWVPNGVEPMLEPNEVAGWSPDAVGRAIVAAAQRLQANGFAVPDFIAPSTSNIGAAVNYVDGMASVPGAMTLIKEFAYHRYGATTADLQALASRAVQHGKRASMLEFWTDGANYRTLHMDLTMGRISAWQKGVFADNFGCSGSHFIQMVSGTPQLCPTTKIIRQYMKYIRPGAERIGATTQNSSFDPVAFINSNGKYVVVVNAEATGSFSISGLPAGTYGVVYTTETADGVNLSNVTLTAGQTLSTSMPGIGAITIYQK
jgi:hypothetical protein